MANSPTRSTFTNLRQLDLKDPTLTALNGNFQFILKEIGNANASSTASSGSGTVAPAAWKDFSPVISGAGGMGVSNVTIFRAQYLTEDNKTYVSMDVEATLVGAPHEQLHITVPVGPAIGSNWPLSGIGFYNSSNVFALTCALSQSSPGGLITVRRFDASNFLLQGVEMTINGVYRS